MKLLKQISLLTVTVILLGILAACAAPAATSVAQPTAPAATGKKFVVATDASFPPMEFVDESKNIVGFDIDLLKAIAADQKFEVEFNNVAWDGIFAGLEAGQYDAIMSSVTVTDERKQKYNFSDGYFDANQAIVVVADNADIKDEKGLTGKKIGVQIETTGAIALRSLGLEPKQYDSPDLAMQDMVNGNLDAVVVDTPVAANFALQSEQFKGKLKIASEIVTNEVYALTVQKGDPKGLLPLFNAGLANVKASGEYGKIYEKWIGKAPAK